MEKLTKEDLELICATSHNKIQEYYKLRYYCEDGFTPSMSLLGQIVINTLVKLDTTQIIQGLRCDMSMLEILHKQDKFTFYEFIWLMFKEWCHGPIVKQLDNGTDLDWRVIFMELRIELAPSSEVKGNE
jgi:hypothetical protein